MMQTISLEMLPAERFGEAEAFYAATGYGGAIAQDCTVFVARRDGEIIGVVRLAPENGVTVLRGMMIAEHHRRCGIGSRLLHFLEPHLAGRNAYCLPHDWLEAFYGRIGFARIEPSAAPRHLQERLAEQRFKHPDLIAMVRRAGGNSENWEP